MNDLKINLLINVDVLESQKMSINFDNNIVHIKTCEMKASINLHIRKNFYIKRIIRVKKTFTVYSETTNVFITYNEILSNDRNFLFESHCSENLSREDEVYTHIIDSFFFFVQVNNVIAKSIILSRRVKLNTVIEYN